MCKMFFRTLILVFYCVPSGFGERNGFLFTAPKVLWSGRRETACISFHGDQKSGRANVTVNIETFLNKDFAVTKRGLETENGGCFEIKVPNTTDQDAKIHLKVNFSDEFNYSINSVDNVKIYPSNGITFIQTDKEVYAPGQRVKIRILKLSQELTVPNDLIIPLVKIRNPVGIAIGQWENITTELGLVQLEHQLSHETILGTWIIELNDTNKKFDVKEYVLPRFEVFFENLLSVYIKDTAFNFTVCARYSYGRPVKGTSHLRIKLTSNEHSVNLIKELLNGCTIFTVKNEEILPKLIYNPYMTETISLQATITEYGSDIIEIKNEVVEILIDKYNLTFTDMLSYFQIGLPYYGHLEVSSNYENIQNKTINICYNLAINKSWNLTDIQCNDFILNDKNVADFIILPYEEDIHSIKITATIKDNETSQIAQYDVQRWYSPSNSYVHILLNDTKPIKCKTWHPINVHYTFNDTLNNDTLTFHYMIMTKGHLIKYGKITHTSKFDNKTQEFKNVIGNVSTNLKLPTDNLVLNIKIHQKMHTDSKLLVYYIKSDGEIVGMERNLNIEDCLNNKVETSWISSQKQPGESVSLKIQAASGSLCALGVVDKKTDFLKTRLRPRYKDLYQRVQKPEVLQPSFDFCNYFTEESIPYWDLRRKKRSLYMPPIHYTTKKSFEDFGTIIMTDLTLPKVPCTSQIENPIWRNSVPMAWINSNIADNYQTQSSNKGADIRSYFPETWLWKLTRIGRSGEITIKNNVPHSITQWIGEAICVSPSAGLGISNLEPLTAFQPFYVDIISPYSIKRQEIFHLKVLVFNYLNHSLPVRITVDETTGIKIIESDEASLTVCINANDTVHNNFRLVATTLHNVNITVTAEVDSAYPGHCGPEVLLNTRDTITKSIKVDYEGFPSENIKSQYVCLEGNNTVPEYLKWDIELPYDVIENSTKLKILMDNDPLSLPIQNVDDLINIPRGCGEQIMATLAPNLYILRYLNSTGSLTNEIYEKAIRNIKIGYERILQYRHRDGSFSAFGEEREDGSVFLTAFVLRTLSMASKYVYIDKNVIEQAAKWLLDRQLENGCFLGGSHVFQPGLMTDDSENSGLTAYVLISLLEGNIPISEKVNKNAKYCLRVGHTSGNKYTLALSTYALALLGNKEDDQLAICLERLLQLASRKYNLLWWEDSDSLSNSIEMTSYVILSLLTRGRISDITLASGATRWLATQRNSLGGFQSTQDTTVALDALTRYQILFSAPPTNLSITILTKNGQVPRVYKVRDFDKLKTKQMTVNHFSDSVSFNITGEGCIILQGILKYNVPQIISGEAFTLAVATSPVSTVDSCSVADVSPCFSSSLPAAHSEMAVLEVELPSGYIADRGSLGDLLKYSDRVQRFEESDNKVVLYFTNLNEQIICTPFAINEVSIVESREPALVKLYDYYNPNLAVYTSYNISKCSQNDILKYQQDTNINHISESQEKPNKPLKYGLNPDFIDKDIELDVPDGIEGPEPSYIKPPDLFIN